MTDPNETEKYFYQGRVKTTWKPGARIEYWLPGEKLAIEGELLEVVPNRKIRHTWHALWDEKIAGDRPTVVTWEITPMGNSCKLSVTYEDLEGRDETYRQVSGGLPYILSGLKTLLETGTRLELPA